MKRRICFLLLFLCCSGCALWKKRNKPAIVREQQRVHQQMDSLNWRQFMKDSLSWEQLAFRNIFVFADSLHPQMLLQERVESRAQRKGQQVTQGQLHQVQQEQFQQEEKQMPKTSSNSYRISWFLGFVLLLLLLFYFAWRRLKVFL